MTAWESFSLEDLAAPFETFARIMGIFAEPLMRLIAFLATVIRMVIEVALQLMNFPVNLISNIITKAMQAINDIQRDPVGFLKNLLRAVKTGFMNFLGNFSTHLINGLVGWLFGELEEAGITAPPDLSFRSILGLVLDVLGISIDRIFEKLQNASVPRGSLRFENVGSSLRNLGFRFGCDHSRSDRHLGVHSGEAQQSLGYCPGCSP